MDTVECATCSDPCILARLSLRVRVLETLCGLRARADVVQAACDIQSAARRRLATRNRVRLADAFARLQIQRQRGRRLGEVLAAVGIQAAARGLLLRRSPLGASIARAAAEHRRASMLEDNLLRVFLQIQTEQV